MIRALAEELEEPEEDPDFIPRPWQQAVRDALPTDPRHKRTIHWVLDHEGDAGKSALARHLILCHNALQL